MKYIYTSTTYIHPLILILFCASKRITLFHMIIIYVFDSLDTILYPSGKLITRNTGNFLVKPQKAQYLQIKSALTIGLLLIKQIKQNLKAVKSYLVWKEEVSTANGVCPL